MLNQRLREIRKSRGKTQQDIADCINVARSTYTCYEKGTRVPDIQTLIKLADYYAVSLDYFADRSVAILSEINLSLDEIELIKKYRALDEHGKKLIDYNLEHEYERSTKAEYNYSHNEATTG